MKRLRCDGTLKISPLILVVTIAVVCVLTGCRSSKVGPPSSSIAGQSTRNNCYSLLHQLLNDEKNVNLLLFIKREEDDVNRLIKKIAAHSATGAKRLEELAKHDPVVRLDDLQLPSGEVATRDAIAATKRKELIGQSGGEFELTLLITQVQALNYAAHLAKVAAANEPQPDRARVLADMSADMGNLYQEVFQLMLSRRK